MMPVPLQATLASDFTPEVLKIRLVLASYGCIYIRKT